MYGLGHICMFSATMCARVRQRLQNIYLLSLLCTMDQL